MGKKNKTVTNSFKRKDEEQGIGNETSVKRQKASTSELINEATVNESGFMGLDDLNMSLSPLNFQSISCRKREFMQWEVTQILLSAQSVDGSVRMHAEESLKQFLEQNPSIFLSSLSVELANDEKPVDSRKLAGLVLKNALVSKEQQRRFEPTETWSSLDVDVKTRIKDSLLQTLRSSVYEARSTASHVLAKVSGIELPQEQKQDLIGSLLLKFNHAAPHEKQATLETLGYLCGELSLYVMEDDNVNKILRAIVQGMNASETSNDVRLAATRALYNALSFAHANFANDIECGNIMRVVCDATLSSEVKIRQAAFECLVYISSTYYEKLGLYMQDILNITAKAVKEDEEPVALQAIEIWSSICEEEIYILEVYFADPSCFYFIKQALPALVPMLLETLLKQEDDPDGAWNVAMAGRTCLGLVARTVGDDILPLVMPFIVENITKPDWRQREAATYAFGSILEGPSLNELVSRVNMVLSEMLSALTKDPNNHVKDTTAWTLGRIFEFVHYTLETLIVTSEDCQQIITVLLHSMKDAPNVAEKACGALCFLARAFVDMPPPFLSVQFFEEIVESLLMVTHRKDAEESRLRAAAYEALNAVVCCSTDEMVLQLLLDIMTALDETLEEQKQQNELQGLLCGCLQEIIRKLALSFSDKTMSAFMQHADRIMNLLVSVFACPTSMAHEEAMLAVGALAYATRSNFEKYMPDFYKYLEMGLQNFEEYQLCAVTVYVVGDIFKALEEKVLPWCDEIITQLLEGLSSNQLHRSVKPLIFSCFGIIAYEIGCHFDKYKTDAMPKLRNAASLYIDLLGADYDYHCINLLGKRSFYEEGSSFNLPWFMEPWRP